MKKEVGWDEITKGVGSEVMESLHETAPYMLSAKMTRVKA